MVSYIRGSDNFDSSSNKVGIWRSSQLTWAASGTYTTSHSLGVVPSSIMFEMVCVTAEDGYAVGDVAVIHSGERYSNWGLQVIENTSAHVKWGVYSSGIIFRNENSGSGQSKVTSNWRVRLVLMG